MTYLPYSLASQLVAEHQRDLEGSAARWRLRRRNRRHPEPRVEDRVFREVPPHIGPVERPAADSPAAAA